METPQAFWDEMLQFIAARQDAAPEQGKAPVPTSHDDLIATAKQQGFDIAPEWIEGQP